MDFVTQVQIGVAVVLVIELLVLGYLVGKRRQRTEENEQRQEYKSHLHQL